jgi:hypothetical protein
MAMTMLAAPRPAQACRFLADQEQQPAPQAPPPAEQPPAQPNPPLDFELLDQTKPPPHVDEGAIKTRRTMLSLHQAAGIGLFGIALANTIVGQLNYSDRFAGGPSTGKYEQAHQITAYATLGVFVGTGLLALLAPNPLPRTPGWDRVSWHKLFMFTAAAAFAAETVLGIYTASREGYLNQQEIATAHLALGYFTFAVVTAGVAVLVF